MDNFDLLELAEELRARIEADQKLLSRVHKYISQERSEQPLKTLDSLVPIDEIESATKGKIRLQQARWLARNRDDNGMSDAFQKIGKRLFVNMPAFTAALMDGRAHR